MKEVYILLTRTRSIVSRSIGWSIPDEFTHASLSLDAEMTRLYSFGRIYEHIAFIGGFVQEYLDRGVFSWDPGIHCAVLTLPVEDRAYYAIEKRITRMYENRKSYRFNIKGLILNYFGYTRSRALHYFCSEFVADTLLRANALQLDRPPASMRPADFLHLPGAELIYRGCIGEYMPKSFRSFAAV